MFKGSRTVRDKTDDIDFSLTLYAADDQGLDFVLHTGPKFGCIKHEAIKRG